MKNLRFVFVVVLVFFSANMAFAQGRFGKDSADCVKNLSFYRDYAKQKDWKEAYPFWVQAFKLCPPTASQQFFIDGVQIMRYMIEQTEDAAVRQERIDTLLMLYDIRMANYKVNEGDVYAFKAYDVLTYRPDSLDAVYDAFLKAVMAGREKTAPHAMITAMQKAIELFQAEKLSSDKLLEVYSQMSEFADLQVKANPDDEQAKKMRQDLENLIGTSGAASCDKLIAMLEPSFDPQDKDGVIRVVQLLKNECASSDLYYRAAEAYHKLDPSPNSAYALARMYYAKGDFNKAVQYYREAITHPDTPQEDKAKYHLEVATVYLKELNNFSQAISNARQALAIEPNNGKVYMLLGNIWGAQRCGDDEIAKKAVFWVAVDFFMKAKSVDHSLADEANKFINNYTQHFPLQQDAFMYDLTDGDAYTVSCNGLTEQTRVRTRK